MKQEPTFMGFTQSELCARADAFLTAEIEKNRKFIQDSNRQKVEVIYVKDQ